VARVSRRGWAMVGLLLVVFGGVGLVTRLDGTTPVNDDRVELVRRSWTAIVEWLETNAPTAAALLHGPADEAAITLAEKDTGRQWPEQLKAWLRMNDGEGRSGQAEVLPMGYLPLGVHWIVQNWVVDVHVTEDLSAPEEIAAGEAQPAGTNATPYLRSWIPIGDDTSGDNLFVDLRPGPLSGSVAEYEPESGGFTSPVLWRDIAAMLEDIAAALHRGRWVHPHDPRLDMVPEVKDGRFGWTSTP